MSNAENRKKGLSSVTVVLIIISLIVLLSYLGWMYKMNDIAKDSYDKRVCKEALCISSITKVKGQDTISTLFSSGPLSDPNSVPCRVAMVEISGDEDSAKSQLAEVLSSSWDMVGEGRLDLFSGEPGDNRYCILTDYITFRGTPAIKGFSSYLEKTPANKLSDGGSYAEYLKCFNTDPSLFTGLQASQDTIDTSKDYGVMFVYAKKGYLHKVWSSIGKAGAGTVIFTVGSIAAGGAPAIVAIGGALVGPLAGGAYGYITGSDKPADWEACITLFPYDAETIKNFNCTYMPGSYGIRPD